MEERYRIFAQTGVTDLDSLRKKDAVLHSRIVCFCDEYGNLVAQRKHRDAIEGAINQLGARARAAGIHLVVAMQDPRAEILSPALKTNLGGRVCLRTTSGSTVANDASIRMVQSHFSATAICCSRLWGSLSGCKRRCSGCRTRRALRPELGCVQLRNMIGAGIPIE